MKLDPTYAPAYNNLAIGYEQQGEFEKARNAYEKALELNPNNTYIKQNYELFREINDRTISRTVVSRSPVARKMQQSPGRRPPSSCARTRTRGATTRGWTRAPDAGHDARADGTSTRCTSAPGRACPRRATAC